MVVGGFDKSESIPPMQNFVVVPLTDDIFVTHSIPDGNSVTLIAKNRLRANWVNGSEHSISGPHEPPKTAKLVTKVMHGSAKVCDLG